MKHNELKTIEKYVLQKLPKAEEYRFLEHLLFCSECRKELEKTEKIIGAIRLNILGNKKRD